MNKKQRILSVVVLILLCGSFFPAGHCSMDIFSDPRFREALRQRIEAEKRAAARQEMRQHSGPQIIDPKVLEMVIRKLAAEKRAADEQVRTQYLDSQIDPETGEYHYMGGDI